MRTPGPSACPGEAPGCSGELPFLGVSGRDVGGGGGAWHAGGPAPPSRRPLAAGCLACREARRGRWRCLARLKGLSAQQRRVPADGTLGLPSRFAEVGGGGWRAWRVCRRGGTALEARRSADGLPGLPSRFAEVGGGGWRAWTACRRGSTVLRAGYLPTRHLGLPGKPIEGRRRCLARPEVRPMNSIDTSSAHYTGDTTPFEEPAPRPGTAMPEKRSPAAGNPVPHWGRTRRKSDSPAQPNRHRPQCAQRRGSPRIAPPANSHNAGTPANLSPEKRNRRLPARLGCQRRTVVGAEGGGGERP
ncbi:hypothetical protein SAMN05216188_112156 [Lentzea xinjiangensis]|uniref:Uncharacterized protein n=1 Tax=Lentzea xinjiangensis TaxID=402600 RepID=A0A1H9PZ10_9PSEU|nr:hypothetical protein SAMN05216188_112156 [Lentzea xinjiangensis]